MTSIPPAPPVSPAAAAPSAPTSASAGSTAVLTQLPAAVRAVSPGTVITGTVTGRDQQGQTLIQTDSGVIAMKTLANLAVGSQVSLQVQAAGSQLQAVILSAIAPSGRPAAGTVPTPAAAGGGAAATTIASTVATGSVLTATVIGPAAAPAAQAPAQGAAAVLRPGQPAPSSAAGTPAAAPPAGAPATPGPVAASATAPAAPPAPGAVPPTAGAPPPPTPTPPGNPPAPAGAPLSPPATAATGTPSAAGTAAPGTPSSGSPAQPTPGAPATPNAAAQPTTTTRTVSAALASYAHTPGATPAPASPQAPGAAPPATPPPATTTTAPAPAVSLQPQPAGTPVQIRLATPGAPATPAAVPTQATLVGRTPSGQTIIDTPVGRLAVNLPPSTGNLPIGSALALEILSLGSPTGNAAALAAGSPAAAARSVPTLGHEWSSLKAAMGALTDIDPPLARQILEISLPRLGTARFLGQVLNQLAGGGAKDARALLGDTAHAVLERNGRADLLARLDAELREMVRLNSSASDWNVMFLPLVDVHELRQMRVYTRKKKQGGRSKDPGRFVVEVELDQLGEMQIDGLIQKPRIDLILRSHVELPPSMQAGIAEVFGRTCDSSGLVGKIFFQATPQFPVAPLDEISRAGPGLSI